VQAIFETGSGGARVAVFLDALGKGARVDLKQSHVEPA
jgi:hypothetical protein